MLDTGKNWGEGCDVLQLGGIQISIDGMNMIRVSTGNYDDIIGELQTGDRVYIYEGKFAVRRGANMFAFEECFGPNDACGEIFLSSADAQAIRNSNIAMDLI